MAALLVLTFASLIKPDHHIYLHPNNLFDWYICYCHHDSYHHLLYFTQQDDYPLGYLIDKCVFYCQEISPGHNIMEMNQFYALTSEQTRNKNNVWTTPTAIHRKILIYFCYNHSLLKEVPYFFLLQPFSAWLSPHIIQKNSSTPLHTTQYAQIYTSTSI